MDKYLKEVSAGALLTPEEEQALAEKAATGDSKARSSLITHNLRYVIEVAKSYQGQGLPLEELIAEGNLGISKAVDKFDCTRKMKFITYAVWWIRQSILQALSEHTRLVRIPINRINEVQKERKKWDIRVQEKSGLIESPISELSEMYSSFPLRLDKVGIAERPVLETFEDTRIESPDQMLEDESLSIELEFLMSCLSDREKEIIRYYHGIGEHRSFTLEEIGNILGLTRERIRQIKKKALTTIFEKDEHDILTKYK